MITLEEVIRSIVQEMRDGGQQPGAAVWTSYGSTQAALLVAAIRFRYRIANGSESTETDAGIINLYQRVRKCT